MSRVEETIKSKEAKDKGWNSVITSAIEEDYNRSPDNQIIEPVGSDNSGYAVATHSAGAL